MEIRKLVLIVVVFSVIITSIIVEEVYIRNVTIHDTSKERFALFTIITSFLTL